MTLCNPTSHFVQHGGSLPAAGTASHERDDAEVAREAATILDLDERSDPVEARVALHATDRADVPGHESRRLLAPSRHHRDVGRQTRESIAREVRRAAGHVDAAMRAGRTSCSLPGLAHRLVRDTTRVHDRDLPSVVVRLFAVAFAKQALHDRFADAPAAAGHQRDPVLEHHRPIPV